MSEDLQLIPITNTADGRQLVPARELHKFLRNKKRFSDWFKQRAQVYKFEEGVDFVPIASPDGVAKKGRGGHNAHDFAVTLDMAKQLSMLEKSEKGREARLYFIRKEQLANVLQAGALEMMANMQERLQQLESTVRLQLTEGDSATILGYARTHHHHIPIQDAVRLGKKAAAMSRARGLEIKTVPDARFGKVNTYDLEILREIFEEEYPLL